MVAVSTPPPLPSRSRPSYSRPTPNWPRSGHTQACFRWTEKQWPRRQRRGTSRSTTPLMILSASPVMRTGQTMRKPPRGLIEPPWRGRGASGRRGRRRRRGRRSSLGNVGRAAPTTMTITPTVLRRSRRESNNPTMTTTATATHPSRTKNHQHGGTKSCRPSPPTTLKTLNSVVKCSSCSKSSKKPPPPRRKSSSSANPSSSSNSSNASSKPAPMMVAASAGNWAATTSASTAAPPPKPGRGGWSGSTTVAIDVPGCF
mmetsp:Transcript_59370/g.64098  ORF Transcript_59370/g.64098 Transcript_59370/m.64098 type:complete len:258 (+) Transcript_59370:260-1033(+)